MKTTLWNPFRGCHKVSTGCKHCYIALGDKKRGRDFDKIEITTQFDRPIRKNKKGDYIIPSGSYVYTSFSSDFLLEDIDSFRHELWEMIKKRGDLTFMFLTKRIERLHQLTPPGFPIGYEHIEIGVSVENQKMADERLPYLLKVPLKHKMIICQPLIGPIDLTPYLEGIELVSVGGEAAKEGRILDDRWVLDIQNQCIKHAVNFEFRQVGSNYLKDGITYKVPWNQLTKTARLLDRTITFKKV